MRPFLFSIGLLLCLSCSRPVSTGTFQATVSDKKATAPTNRLYSSMFQLTKKGVMLGHQDDLAYNILNEKAGSSDMKTVCGDYPAVFGWDLGKLETGSPYNADSISFEYIKQSIKEVHKWGGISTLSWHADNPTETDLAENCFPDSIIESVLPGNENHAKYLAYLDQLAGFFLDLQDEQGNLIPVIFRPFHSANDQKYWWNIEQNPPDKYKRLWIMSVDYLRINKKVNHLIYAYSTYNVKNLEEFMLYYPGNDYVDIVGSEVYFSLDTDPSGEIFKQDLERNLAVITAFSKKNHKIPSLTEIGLEGIKVFNFFSDYVYPIVTKYPISYMVFWKNARNNNAHYFIPVPGHPACDDFIYFVNKPNILTCEKI
jgi:beta-mannanase